MLRPSESDPSTAPAPGVGIELSVSDTELATRAAGGDLRAFECIMRRYNQRLFRLAFGMFGEASEAEDILQES